MPAFCSRCRKCAASEFGSIVVPDLLASTYSVDSGGVAARADGCRVGRVEHVKTRPARSHADDRAHHLGREARSAHPEQDDVGEAGGLDAVRERPAGDRSSRPSAAATSSTRAGRRSLSAPPAPGSRRTGRLATVRRPRVRPRRSSWRPPPEVLATGAASCGGGHAWPRRRSPANASSTRARWA